MPYPRCKAVQRKYRQEIGVYSDYRSLMIYDRDQRLRDEDAQLSPIAKRTSETKGRLKVEEPDLLRTAYERDRDRIVHNKAFRRLKDKTQVFVSPLNDHVITRLTHTLQVTQIGRAIARALRLNEPLTEAICLGHDVGHSPFGHIGEEAFSPYVDGEWLHSDQSVRIFETLEPENLSWEVIDGIRTHSWKINPPPTTAEGMVCRYADRIAYLTHDVEDALRSKVLTTPSQLPAYARKIFGEPGSDWIDVMINAVVYQSERDGALTMEPSVFEAMHIVRDFMFERVYLRPEAKAQAATAITVLRDLTDYYLEHPSEIPASYRHVDASNTQAALDYVSGMTDRFALELHHALATEAN